MMAWRCYKKKVYTWAKKMDEEFVVTTLEGTMVGKPGDYLCRDSSGNHYPCDAGIFKQMYEEVEPDEIV